VRHRGGRLTLASPAYVQDVALRLVAARSPAGAR
jgi:hypothetical protein